MTTIEQIYQIEKTTDEIRKTVLTNIIKMLTARKLLNYDKIEDNIKKITETISDDQIYIIDLDQKIDNYDKYIIKLSQQQIKAIKKSYGIDDFLHTYKNKPKIIVVKDISTKASRSILNDYKRTEIFTEEFLMINLIDHNIVPRHELLTEEETNIFFEKYNCKKKNMPKILIDDPVARYYNMKIGDICRIIRPSEKSGLTVSYRLVIKGYIK